MRVWLIDMATGAQFDHGSWRSIPKSGELISAKRGLWRVARRVQITPENTDRDRDALWQLFLRREKGQADEQTTGS